MEIDIEFIISQMTVEEKIGQLLQVDIQSLVDIDGIISYRKLKALIKNYHIGSLMNSIFSILGRKGWNTTQWRQFIADMHEITNSSNISKTKSKIPIIYGIDSAHGAGFVYGATIFPQQIGMVTAFDANLVSKIGAVTSKDTRAARIQWLFSPVLGIAYAPSWARFPETFGEDPHIASELGAAMIQGIQTVGKGVPSTASACMKHFIGYSAPNNGHDRSPVNIPDRMLNQLWKPVFERAIREGVLTVMSGYLEIDGIPMISSNQYLNKVLRNDIKFAGLLVSDYAEVYNLHSWHKVAETIKEALRIIFTETSVDMLMLPAPGNVFNLLLQLVRERAVPESRIDESVRRILIIKSKLGLLNMPIPFLVEDPYVNSVGQQEDWNLSLQTARESITLLKNIGNMLPLPRDASILLTGPTAHCTSCMSGGWTFHWQGAFDDSEFTNHQTIFTAFQNASLYSGKMIYYAEGPLINDQDLSHVNISAIKLLMEEFQFNAIVVCIGESSYVEKKGDIDELQLDKSQVEYVDFLRTLGVPIVTVLIAGRPRLLHSIVHDSEALIHAYLPGPLGGVAIVETLFGHLVPSGRLPFTYPKHSGDISYPYYHKLGDMCIINGSPSPCDVEFKFGAGLSYTTFVYSNFELSKTEVNELDTIRLSVNITNTGLRAAIHTILLFVYQIYRRVIPENKLQKRFEKKDLLSRETKKINWELNNDDLKHVGVDRRY